MEQTITIEEILEHLESFQAAIIDGIIDIGPLKNENYFNHIYKTEEINEKINNDFWMAEKMLLKN